MEKQDKICSFFGHRQIKITNNLIIKINKAIENLIVNENFDIFYFGGYSEFDKLCYDICSKLKLNYPHIKLIFIRPYYENLNQNIINLYKKDYDDCIYLKPKNNFGKLAIIYRNYEIINKSDFILFYTLLNKKGGALLCYNYCLKLKKRYINLAEN